MERSNEILYMLGVVAVGMLVTFLIRAIPFVLFAGKNRPLPTWVEKFGAFISPIIIFALIIYAYTGLEWKTLWPYLAGALTIVLQLWKGNPLASILAGTILYMILINCCGCVSAPLPNLHYENGKPCVEYTAKGVKIGNQFVDDEDVPSVLERCGIPKDETIHILLDKSSPIQQAAYNFQYGVMGPAGYKRTILISNRIADSRVQPKRSKPIQKQPKKKFRYKRANEQ